MPTFAEIFKGWTGTDLTEPTMTVTIPASSIGGREYTARRHRPQHGHTDGDHHYGQLRQPHVHCHLDAYRLHHQL